MAANNTAIGNEQANVHILDKDQELLDYAYSMKQMREGYEPMAYLSRRAYEGKHFTYWNKNIKQLVEIPQKKSVVATLPEIKNQADKFENFLASTDFVFTLIPALLSEDDAVKESMMLSLLARHFFDKLKDTTVMSDWIHYAITDSNVSFVEATPDKENKDVTYHCWDFFDILFNPLIRKWEDQTIVVKIIKKNIHDLKKSELYNLPTDYKPAGIGGEWRSWKDVYEAEHYQSFADLDKDMVLIFEFQMMTKDGLKIRTLDGASNVIRNSHYPAVKRIPIVPLRIYSGEWWQPGYVYQLIPMNRSLDTMINRFDDMFLRLTKGGWLTQEEEDIQGAMNEEMGQIIKYASVKPDPITMGTVPNFFVELFSTFLSLSERYGLNSVFSGNLPNKASGLRSGKMIDQIKGLTQQNNTSTMSHMKSSVKSLLEITFGFLYEMWDEPQDRIQADQLDKSPKFVSDKFKDVYAQEDNVFAIPDKFKKFTVEIDDGLGYTLKARQEMAIQLYNLKDEQGKPLLSSGAVKKIFKMGASGYLMEADDKPMHMTKEFQDLIGNFGNMTDQQKQALITTLQTIGQQQTQNTPPGQIGQKMIEGAQGGGQPPPGPPQGGGGQPPAPPKPAGGGGE